MIWTPSHGKLKSWKAPAEVDTATARELNELADRACTARLSDLRPGFEAAVRAWEEAVSWSIQAAEAQMAATAPFGDKYG